MGMRLSFSSYRSYHTRSGDRLPPLRPHSPWAPPNSAPLLIPQVCPSSSVRGLVTPLFHSSWLWLRLCPVLWAPSLFALCTSHQLPLQAKAMFTWVQGRSRISGLGLRCSLQAVRPSASGHFCSQLGLPGGTVCPSSVLSLLPPENGSSRGCPLVTKAPERWHCPQSPLTEYCPATCGGDSLNPCFPAAAASWWGVRAP